MRWRRVDSVYGRGFLGRDRTLDAHAVGSDRASGTGLAPTYQLKPPSCVEVCAAHGFTVCDSRNLVVPVLLGQTPSRHHRRPLPATPVKKWSYRFSGLVSPNSRATALAISLAVGVAVSDWSAGR